MAKTRLTNPGKQLPAKTTKKTHKRRSNPGALEAIRPFGTIEKKYEGVGGGFKRLITGSQAADAGAAAVRLGFRKLGSLTSNGIRQLTSKLDGGQGLFSRLTTALTFLAGGSVAGAAGGTVGANAKLVLDELAIAELVRVLPDKAARILLTDGDVLLDHAEVAPVTTNAQQLVSMDNTEAVLIEDPVPNTEALITFEG
jgi:hypothetical protein